MPDCQHIFPADHLSNSRHQQGKQRPFPLSHFQHAVTQPGQRQLGIEPQKPALSRSDLQRSTKGRQARTPQQGIKACLQFLHVKRLGEIVIRARIEPLHPVINRIARSQDHDRHCAKALAGPLEHGDAADDRKAEVKHHCIKPLPLQQPLRSDAAVSDGYDMPLLRELFCHSFPQQGIVLHYQQIRHVLEPVGFSYSRIVACNR